MSAPASLAAASLARIAATLGVPVEAFTSPAAAVPADAPPALLVAALLRDLEGLRLAAAILALPPSARASLINVVAALAAATAAPADCRAGGTA